MNFDLSSSEENGTNKENEEPSIVALATKERLKIMHQQKKEQRKDEYQVAKERILSALDVGVGLNENGGKMAKVVK